MLLSSLLTLSKRGGQQVGRAAVFEASGTFSAERREKKLFSFR
jgi:hypothetical protein